MTSELYLFSGMLRLTSRDNTPAKDLGFNSDAAGGAEFRRTLCVLHRHRNKIQPELIQSLSMSDGEEHYQHLKQGKYPCCDL